MAKTLKEAAADMLRQAATTNQEPFGAGKNPQAYAPQPSAASEDLGGDTPEDTSASGAQVAAAAGPQATPPGKVGLGNGEDQWNRRNPNSVGTEVTPMQEEEELEEEGFDTDTTKSEVEYDENQMDDEDDENVDPDDHPGIPTAAPVDQRVAAYVKNKDPNIAGMNVQEDISAIFSGENLSKAFINKATKVYEAAVVAAATKAAVKIAEEIEAEYVAQLEYVTEGLKNNLTEQVDDYLSYMVEEWVKENEVAIEKGIRAELVEDFIAGLRNLFVEHYIDIPEDQVHVVEELASEVDDLKSKLNEETAKNIKFRKELNEHRKKEVVRSVCEGLAETQVQKMLSLSESVDFTNVKEYADNLSTLRENYFPTTRRAEVKKSAVRQLDEESVPGDERGMVDPSDEMAIYAKAISKSRN